MYRIYTISLVLLVLLLCVLTQAKAETPHNMVETCKQRFHELLEENFMQTWESSEAETSNGTLRTYVKQKPYTDEEVVVVAVSNDAAKKGTLGGIVFVTFYVNGVVCGMRPSIP